MSSDLRVLIREAEAAGWMVSVTGGGHLRFAHALARYFVITAGTPSDWRAVRNARRALARALEGGSRLELGRPRPAASDASGRQAGH